MGTWCGGSYIIPTLAIMWEPKRCIAPNPELMSSLGEKWQLWTLELVCYIVTVARYGRLHIQPMYSYFHSSSLFLNSEHQLLVLGKLLEKCTLKCINDQIPHLLLRLCTLLEGYNHSFCLIEKISWIKFWVKASCFGTCRICRVCWVQFVLNSLYGHVLVHSIQGYII